MKLFRVHSNSGSALIEADCLADAWQTSLTDPSFLGQRITHIVQAASR